MRKTIIEGALTILLFFGTWLALSQIDWLQILKIKEAKETTEQKLGELFWDVFKKAELENQDLFLVQAVDSIVTQLCEENNIARETIKVHILNNSEINAFALPNKHLVIYSGLIINAENPEELAGVICHELAHIELNHVMKKLVKEIGLSVLISMTTGNGGPELIKETAKMLSSTAFDRNLEKEADVKAVDFLLNAEVNPEPFAHFLFRLSDKEHEATKYLTWMSTHPDSRARAEYIIEYGKNRIIDFKPIIAEPTWINMRNRLKE